jgi:hypothetical protein
MKISSPKAINWTLKQYGYIDGAVVYSRMLPTSKRDAALNFLLLIWAQNSAAT